MNMALGPGRMPFQLPLIVQSRPQFWWQLAIDAVDVGEREIGFEHRGPGGTFDLTDLLAVLSVIKKCFANWLVAINDDFGQPPARRS